MIKVLIADDMQDIRDYFGDVLSKEQNMQVVGYARNGKEAVEFALKYVPDIVLIDIQMEGNSDGIEAIEKISELLPNTKCIVITIHAEDQFLYRAYAVGAIDYIIKTDSISRVVSSVNSVYNNTLSMRPEIAERLMKEFCRMKKQEESLMHTMHLISRLTTSELSIVKMLYEGASYRQIARERCVTLDTVKTQVKRILKKFEMARMKEVVSLLRRLKIFDSFDYLNKV